MFNLWSAREADLEASASPHLRLLLIFFLFVARIHVDLSLFPHSFPEPLALHSLALPGFCRGRPARTALVNLAQTETRAALLVARRAWAHLPLEGWAQTELQNFPWKRASRATRPPHA